MIRWPWRKCRNVEGINDAREALEREKKAGEDVEAKRPTVESLANDMAKHHRENHFANLIRKSLS